MEGLPLKGMSMSISSALFKELMSFQCSSVAVISAVSPEGITVGFTATSLQSVSAAPPTVVFCLSSQARSRAVFSCTEFIGVSLLPAAEREIGERYSNPGTARFTAGEHFIGEYGVPILRCAVFYMIGRVVNRMEVGDSTVYFLEITSGTKEGADEPLLYFRREFRNFSHT